MSAPHAERPTWLHRRSATCPLCAPPIADLEASGWLLPDGRPDIGYCVTDVPAPAGFGRCALCSVPSARVIVVTAWAVGSQGQRWASCIDACSTHAEPAHWTWIDWRWLLIDGARMHLPWAA
jgi:hypothetical protein